MSLPDWVRKAAEAEFSDVDGVLTRIVRRLSALGIKDEPFYDPSTGEVGFPLGRRRNTSEFGGRPFATLVAVVEREEADRTERELDKKRAEQASADVALEDERAAKNRQAEDRIERKLEGHSPESNPRHQA